MREELIKILNRLCKSTKSYLYKYYVTGYQDFEDKAFTICNFKKQLEDEKVSRIDKKTIK